MSEEQFAKVIDSHPSKLLFDETKTWAMISFDEAKLKLNTHDDTGRRAERTVKSGKDDKGETLSAKSSCSLSGMGGSHGNGQPIKPLFPMGGWLNEPFF